MTRNADVLRAVGGYFLLLPLMPLVGTVELLDPTSEGVPFAFSWANLPSSQLGVTYLIVSVLLVIVFAIFSTHRRAVLVAFVFSAVAWYAILGDLNELGMAAVIGVIGVVLVAVEGWRQNRSVIRQLIATRRTIGKTSLRQAAVLWSPVTVIVALAILINMGTNAVLTRLLFSMPNVDEYCSIDLVSPESATRRFPCTGMEGVIYPLSQRELYLRENVEVQVPESFLRVQQAIVQELESIDDETLSQEEQFKARISDISGRIVPNAVLGLTVPGDSLATRLEGDPELRELRVRAQDLQAQYLQARLQRFPRASSFGGISIVVPRMLAERELGARAASAQQAADGRIAALQAAMQEEIAQWGPGQLLAQQFASVVPANSPVFTVSGLDNVVALKRWTVDQLSRFQAQALEDVLHRVEPAGEADIVTENQLNDPIYAALSLKRLCLLSQMRTDDEDEEYTVNARPYECWDLVAGPNAVTELSVRESLEESVDWWEVSQRQKLELELQKSVRAADRSEQAARVAGQGLIAAVPLSIYLGRGKCKWYKPGTWATCGVNYAKSKAEDAYANGRRKAGKAAVKVLDRGVDKAGDKASVQLFIAYQEAKTLLRSSAQGLKAAIAKSASAVKLFQYLTNLALSLAVIKSILYVLTVTTLTNTPSLKVGLSPPRVSKRGFVVAAGPAATRKQILIHRPVITDSTLTNSVSNPYFLGWPWPFSSPMSRIFARKYWLMRHCTPGEPRQAMSVTSDKHIICWTLKPGEEVVFSYRHFYGASPNLKFSSTVSLAVTSLPLGRVVFHIARCEGTKVGQLLLKVDSLEFAHRPEGMGVTPDRLIAWNRQAEFTFMKALTHGSMLVGDYTLVHQDDGPAGGWVVVSAGGEPSPLGGLFRIVRRILF